MAKKQKSFAEKAAGQGGVDTVWVKYVKSVKSEQTGKYRFNEQMIGLQGGESLDAALKRLDEASNLIDIDLSEFIAQQAEEVVTEETAVEVEQSSEKSETQSEETAEESTEESAEDTSQENEEAVSEEEASDKE